MKKKEEPRIIPGGTRLVITAFPGKATTIATSYVGWAESKLAALRTQMRRLKLHDSVVGYKFSSPESYTVIHLLARDYLGITQDTIHIGTRVKEEKAKYLYIFLYECDYRTSDSNIYVLKLITTPSGYQITKDKLDISKDITKYFQGTYSTTHLTVQSKLDLTQHTVRVSFCSALTNHTLSLDIINIFHYALYWKKNEEDNLFFVGFPNAYIPIDGVWSISDVTTRYQTPQNPYDDVNMRRPITWALGRKPYLLDTETGLIAKKNIQVVMRQPGAMPPDVPEIDYQDADGNWQAQALSLPHGTSTTISHTFRIDGTVENTDGGEEAPANRTGSETTTGTFVDIPGTPVTSNILPTILACIDDNIIYTVKSLNIDSGTFEGTGGASYSRGEDGTFTILKVCWNYEIGDWEVVGSRVGIRHQNETATIVNLYHKTIVTTQVSLYVKDIHLKTFSFENNVQDYTGDYNSSYSRTWSNWQLKNWWPPVNCFETGCWPAPCEQEEVVIPYCSPASITMDGGTYQSGTSLIGVVDYDYIPGKDTFILFYKWSQTNASYISRGIPDNYGCSSYYIHGTNVNSLLEETHTTLVYRVGGVTTSVDLSYILSRTLTGVSGNVITGISCHANKYNFLYTFLVNTPIFNTDHDYIGDVEKRIIGIINISDKTLPIGYRQEFVTDENTWNKYFYNDGYKQYAAIGLHNVG